MLPSHDVFFCFWGRDIQVPSYSYGDGRCIGSKFQKTTFLLYSDNQIASPLISEGPWITAIPLLS